MFKKVLKLTLLFVLGILSLFAVSCAGTAGGGIDLEDTALSVSLPNTNNKALWDVSDVQVFTVTISSKSYKDTKTAPGGNTITFSNIPVGHYNIEAIGKNNNGDLTAKGSAEVDVMENVNSSVTVKLSRLDYYTVEFDLEGGTGAISEQKVTTGYTAKRPDNPTNSDPLYHFVGWTRVLAANIADCVLYDFATPVNGDMTLHAIWSKDPCVTFDYNYAGASPDLIPVTTGTVSSRSASRPGATFKGWSTSSASYVPFDFSTPVASDMTLYAIWEFSVSFNLNYTGAPTGTIPDQTVADGSCATLPTAPTRTGYSFIGWGTTSTAAAADKVNVETATISANTTYYAIWGFKVSFNLNYTGASSSIEDQILETAGYATEPEDPTRTGYNFVGWGVTASSTVPVDLATTTISDSTTFYAIWRQEVTVTVSSADDIKTALSTYTNTDITINISSEISVSSLSTVNNGSQKTYFTIGNNNTIDIVGGTIKLDVNTTDYLCLFYVKDGSTLNLSGTTVSGIDYGNKEAKSIYVASGGTVTIGAGTTVSGFDSNGNSPIFVSSNGILNIEGGCITGNTARYGAALSVYGTCNMKSGSITGNSGGNGCVITGSGTFNWTGGTITSNINGVFGSDWNGTLNNTSGNTAS